MSHRRAPNCKSVIKLACGKLANGGVREIDMFPSSLRSKVSVRIAVVVFQYRYQTLTDHLLESKSVFDSLPYCCRRFDLLVVYGDLTSIIKSSSSSFLIPTRYTLFKLYLHSTFSSGKSRSKCNAEVATQESLQCALD